MAETTKKDETAEDPEDYEKLFAHRFTSEDREYQEYLKRPPDPPPIVENWRGRGGGNHRGRDNRYQDRRAYGGRGWGGGRDYGGERGWRAEHRGQQWHDRDRDRSYGRDRDRDRSPHRGAERSWDRDRDRAREYRGGYQSHPQSSNQVYSQRPQYDRY
ncbi:RNA guanine-N7 methyltransferase-activating subunit-like protein [Boleophthalmus pectinirostris]|uniref:RNA guanine-N7 methyltransferase-activating subunit-like protein n=1 Tax=Boleophthalmus pectinirostris TaxID=150288 RepID=UPI000A1C1C58|nr:RNA guanine-N7 methyltransferase-activating subunit-like protein [Boleophthalmus pectinirostris]